MKNTKKTLISSAIALFLCFSMLLGTTYAWFTDSASSTGNIIKSGNLDVEMYWSEKLLTADSDEWKNADGVPIFTYDNWEPGYTDVKYIKVKNAGDLSLKWRLNIEAEGEVTDLADVIDVYYVNPATSEITTLEGMTSNGVLSDVIKDHTAMDGVLLPEGEVSTEYTVGETILAIAFHMQEEAGNDYKNKSIGSGFSVSLIATQFGYENDAFGDDYDEGATFPNQIIVGTLSASADVTVADGKVSAPVSMANGTVNAEIPAGVKLDAGVDKLTLKVSGVSESKANITLDESEATLSVDVHVDGVAEDNDVVMAIGIDKLLPVGLNMGNYRFYHVEDGATVEMILLENGATPVHNNYEYDPATGNVILYLKSFSEVAFITDKDNEWNGECDFSWYDANATELTIANANQLAAFGRIVGGMTNDPDDLWDVKTNIAPDSFEGKTVKLVANIDLCDAEANNDELKIFYPIGYYNSTESYTKVSGGSVSSGYKPFMGTFDGNGNTISNIYQNTWEMFGDYNDGYSGTPNHSRDGMGLFGKIIGGTVKNLTVRNFSSDGEFATTGVIAAYADSGATFENIAIFDCNPRVYNIGNGGIVGCVGWYANDADLNKVVTFKNITVDNTNKITALWGSWDVACGGILGQYYPTSGQTNAIDNAGVHFENCHVAAQIDVYNDVCANYQYYAYRYSGMLIGSVRENFTDTDGHVYPNMDGITATGCTVHFGEWQNYYYCEFEKNSMASYSEDYQFSRVPHSEINFTDSNGNGIIDTEAEIASVTGCKHNHTAAEDKQAVYLPFNNLVTGYGWGVTSRGLKNLDGVKNVIITEGDYDKAVQKFAKKDDPQIYNAKLGGGYKIGTPIKLGALFDEIGEISIDSSTVFVSVSPVYDNTQVSINFERNATDWKESTITFTTNSQGPAKIVITDYFYCIETEVVLDAYDNTFGGGNSDADDILP